MRSVPPPTLARDKTIDMSTPPPQPSRRECRPARAASPPAGARLQLLGDEWAPAPIQPAVAGTSGAGRDAGCREVRVVREVGIVHPRSPGRWRSPGRPLPDKEHREQHGRRKPRAFCVRRTGPRRTPYHPARATESAPFLPLETAGSTSPCVMVNRYAQAGQGQTSRPRRAMPFRAGARSTVGLVVAGSSWRITGEGAAVAGGALQVVRAPRAVWLAILSHGVDVPRGLVVSVPERPSALGSWHGQEG
jgi:hypothetical protein